MTYLSKFSNQDYAAIEERVEDIFQSLGSKKIDKDERCRYRAPSEYSSARLYCSIEMVTYLDYQSDAHAIEVAKSLEKQVEGLGTTVSNMSTFYAKPGDTYTGVSVTFAPPLRNRQCHFSIASHEKARRLSSFLPEQTEDNLLGILFDCSAESRKEYFPVTYRQD
jgi:hypothetical protein